MVGTIHLVTLDQYVLRWGLSDIWGGGSLAL